MKGKAADVKSRDRRARFAGLDSGCYTGQVLEEQSARWLRTD
jgi:hypothetical protein